MACTPSRPFWNLWNEFKDLPLIYSINNNGIYGLLNNTRIPSTEFIEKTCVLVDGILRVYNKPKDVKEGKSILTLDLGSSIISHQNTIYLSINTDDQVYRFKVKDNSLFKDWLRYLTSHRLYRLDQLVYGGTDQSKTSMRSTVSPVSRTTDSDRTAHLRRITLADIENIVNALTSTYAESTAFQLELKKVVQSSDSNARNKAFQNAYDAHKRLGELLVELEKCCKHPADVTKREHHERSKRDHGKKTEEVESESQKSEKHEKSKRGKSHVETATDEEKSEKDSTSEKSQPDEGVVNEYVQAAAGMMKSPQTVAKKTFRTSLPAPETPCTVSIWGILMSNIGKDMTKLMLPVELFEPLGMLQLLCEELEYSYLLDKAINQKDSLMRMVLVACFAVSRYAASAHRGHGKMFNPFEGETYENIREDLGWRFISEQFPQEGKKITYN